MQVFLPYFLLLEMTSTVELLAAQQEIRLLVNERGLGLFLVSDGIEVWLVLQPGAEFFHSCSLLVPKLPGIGWQSAGSGRLQ